MLVGLLTALGAAGAFGVASVLQTVGGRRVGPAPLGPRLVSALLGQPLFAIGVFLDVCGFLLNLVALRRLPLFVVQPAVGSAVAVTAVLASGFLGEKLGSARRWALLGTMIGLTLVATSALPGHAPSGGATVNLLLAGGAILLAVAAVLVDRRWREVAGVPLAVLSGLAFGGFGLAGRTLTTPGSPVGALLEPGLWVAAVLAVGGLALFGAALQRSTVTVVMSVSMAVESLVGASVGLLLWDHVRSGYWPAVVAGLALCVGCAPVLARAEPPETTDDGMPAARHLATPQP